MILHKKMEKKLALKRGEKGKSKKAEQVRSQEQRFLSLRCIKFSFKLHFRVIKSFHLPIFI